MTKEDLKGGRARRKVGQPSAGSVVTAGEHGAKALFQARARSGAAWLDPASRHIDSSYAEAAAQRLTRRDWAIIRTLQRVHLVAGPQLERLHFHEPTEGGRHAARSRVLKRLVDLRIVAPLGNPGVRGANPRCYVLDSVGLLLVRMQTGQESYGAHMRGTGVLGRSFVARALALTELFVNLVEQDRAEAFTLEDFRADAAARWPNGLGGHVEPGAFVRVSRGDVACYWWVELHDQTVPATDLRARLLAYVGLAESDGLGPDGVVPRVLIGTCTDDEAEYAQFVVDGLPEQAREIFAVTPMPDALQVIAGGLR